MLKVTVEQIVEKLSEYGMALYTDYPTKDQGHCFMTKGMVLFLDEEDDSIAITFQADSKPEDVASNLMILSEIENVSDISIMESFIYDKNNKFVTGNEAHNIVRNSLIEEAFKKVATHQAYNEILMRMPSYNC